MVFFCSFLIVITARDRGFVHYLFIMIGNVSQERWLVPQPNNFSQAPLIQGFYSGLQMLSSSKSWMNIPAWLTLDLLMDLKETRREQIQDSMKEGEESP